MLTSKKIISWCQAIGTADQHILSSSTNTHYYPQSTYDVNADTSIIAVSTLVRFAVMACA